MIARIPSAVMNGIDAAGVDVEAHVSGGLRAFLIVGLPDTAIREARERVKAGIINSEFEFPNRRITVSLAPADLKKEGPAFDLPIAISVLAATRQAKLSQKGRYLVIGELALDGAIRRVAGALAFALYAKSSGSQGIIVPAANAKEAALVQNLDVIPVSSLSEAVNFLSGACNIDPLERTALVDTEREAERDLAEIRGQEHAKRALEIAAAGGHNILMYGPPGSGKTMLAESLPGLLTALSLDEAIEVTKIYSAARLLSADCPLITQRPFRSPHHTASDIALAGGGVYPRPGELSLSHNGVLFLDEINEFHRNALEVLRQPLERGFVTISRASGAIDYPTRIILAAAMNPCPCGYLGDSVRDCSCTPQQIRGYRNKLSGPLRDRIDIHLSVARLPADQLMRTQKAETTLEVRKRVEAARERQSKRYADTGIRSNATLRPAAIKTYCKLDDQSEQFLVQAVERLGLTARSYMKVIKVARTIADIGDEDRIRLAHVAEAVQYRGLDRRIGA